MVFKIDSLMRERGITTQVRLAELTGIHPTRIGPLVRGTVRRIDVETVERLCRGLNCQPGDIMVYEPDPDEGR